MKVKMPDSVFLENADLRRREMGRAAGLLRAGRRRAAALEAARVMFSRPFRLPVRESEIPALAGAIRERFPAQVEYLTALAENYVLKRSPADGVLCGRSAEDEAANFRRPADLCLRRAEGVHLAARLYRLTGRRKFLSGAVRLAKRILGSCGPFPDGERAGSFVWHPYDSGASHQPAHIACNICLALPYIRPDVAPEDALAITKGLLAIADFCFRTNRHDPMFNIPLHMITAGHFVGVSFPALKKSARWVRDIRRRLVADCTRRPFATREGYFGEGLGYQAVDQSLVLMNILLMEASGASTPARLRRASEASFYFSARIMRNDGKFPLFGDAKPQASWEHHINQHEILHLAAASFGCPDFKAAAGSPHREEPMEYNVWLMGKRGLEWWDSVGAAPRAQRRQEPHDLGGAGFQVLGAGCGTEAHYGLLACAATHNHAHHDFGSIDISGLGRPLLTDPGVCTYAVDREVSERVHNTVALIRRRPSGPRIESLRRAATRFLIHRPDIQAACMEHDLYEEHRVRRTLCLVTAGEHPFWVVIDRVERASPRPAGTTPIYESLETYFHFNSPQGELGRREAAMTCWSRFAPEGFELLRYPPGDAGFRAKPERVALADFLAAHEESTSDANVQVTAVLPRGRHYIMDMRFFESSTGNYFGRVRRPSVAYRFRGHLPYDAAYVVMPFKGVRRSPCARVSGRWSKGGSLDLEVGLPEETVEMRVAGLTSRNPRPRFAVVRRRG